MLIVRRGHGATGLKDAWSRQQIAAGKIPFRVGRFYADEMAMLEVDSELAFLSPHPRRRATWRRYARARAWVLATIRRRLATRALTMRTSEEAPSSSQ